MGFTVMCEGKNTVLCGANAYEMKYYFNERFNGIPESVKDELHIICVLFTEACLPLPSRRTAMW